MLGVKEKKAIEYFLVMRDEVAGDKLVYYDQQGTRFQVAVQRETIDLALKVFNGKMKAIQRTSGGLIQAEPYQLIVFDPNEVGQTGREPQIRIKVKFKDFRPDKLGNVNFEDYQISTKILNLHEILDPFSYSLNGQQRFVLDFGRGLVPVYVFHYDVDLVGNAMAYFVEVNALKRSLTGKVGDSYRVQPYRVARQTLRYASDLRADGTSEYKFAMENYDRLLQQGMEPIPEGFSAGSVIEVPLPHTHQSLRRYLRENMGFKDSENTSTTVRAQLPLEGDENPEALLLPFGALEKESGVVYELGMRSAGRR